MPVVRVGAVNAAHTIGIIGGGQLARMMQEEASALGIHLRALVEAADGSTGQVTPDAPVGAADDEAAVRAVVTGDGSDGPAGGPASVLTFEHEHQDSALLERLQAEGVSVQPTPQALTLARDKLAMRRMMSRAGLPQPAWDEIGGSQQETAEQMTDAVEAFADEHGLPIAVKAAFGGGGRGIKVARDRESIVEMYESAVREATAAFGRGECFIERFLDSPRHVETQCLADAHGNVVVVSTRDCSLQRRNQKLVEEAPAPYLSEEQTKRLYEASRAILREAGYQGAGTCEFLVGTDGTISFLEVNTRLQVEHPVSEEISGLDLVREQFRIARGEKIEEKDPVLRGHSFEFRINGEDPGRSFMPAPGTIEKLNVPTGPGVRWDSGFVAGDVIGGNFDSMLAKLIVTGADREQALQRARRALSELSIEGMPTVIPFHRVVLEDPAFVPAEGEDFKVHTRWIETEFNNTIPMYAGAPGSVDSDEDERTTVVVEVNGKRMEVSLPEMGGAAKPAAKPASKSRKSRSSRASAKAGGDELTSPMQGTIVKVAVSDGDTVAEGDLVLVLEAMKMEQPITAHKAGKVSGLSAKPGDTVTSGAVLATIK